MVEFMTDKAMPSADTYFEVHELPDSSSLEDKLPQGTYDFPLAIFEDHMNRKMSGYVRLHWHEVLQFSYVTRGHVSFTIDSRTYRLGEGSGIFINSEVMHMATADDEPDSIYRCVNFSPRMLRGFEGSAAARKYVEPYIDKTKFPCAELTPDIISQLHAIYDVCHAREYGYEMFAGAALGRMWLDLISECLNKGSAAAPPAADSDRIKPMISYIHSLFERPLTLTGIAAAGSVSRGECCRLFNRSIGMTPFEYLIKYRIEKSLALLHDTDRPVSVIADKVGFNSTSYYIKCFKKITGGTPKKYRMMRGDDYPSEYLD